MRLCNRVIATNEYLATRVSACSGKDVCIIPNFINREQLEVSDRVFEAKRTSRFARTERFHIGYFSGSPSHNKDFQIVSGALARLMDTDSRLHLRLVGYLDVQGPVGRHSNRIERYPMQDFLNLQRLVGSTEINIVPLQNNVFTNCKSELKYFEAAVVGTNTIASPTFAFARIIQEGTNGWLSDAHEWEIKLRQVIDELTTSPDAYIAVAEHAHDYAQHHFSWGRQFGAIKAALFR